MDQNALTISLLDDGTDGNPVVVPVATPFLGNGDNQNGVYKGVDAAQRYGWILYKTAKANFVQDALTVAGDFVQLASAVAKTIGGGSWNQYTTAANTVVDKLDSYQTPDKSDNSQVDNISSVLFGIT